MIEKSSRFREIDPHYYSHISQEIDRADEQFPKLIMNPHVDYFGCVDPLTEQFKKAGSSALAGGGLKMQDIIMPMAFNLAEPVNGLRMAFIVRAEHSIKLWTVGVHLGCGEMLVGEKLWTVSEQINRLGRFFRELDYWNTYYKDKTHADLKLETNGTAFEYMDKQKGDWLKIQKLKFKKY